MLEKIYDAIGWGSLILVGSFGVLKLLGIIEWSWFWVASPLWIPFFCLLGFVYLVLKNKDRKET